MTRPPALVKAQAAYEAKRNARKVLVRLSEAEAEAIDDERREGESREAAIKRLVRNRR